MYPFPNELPEAATTPNPDGVQLQGVSARNFGKHLVSVYAGVYTDM